MVRIVFRDDAGNAAEIEARAGQSLMESAKAAGIAGIEAECGGSMVCATCQVYVAPDWVERLPPPARWRRRWWNIPATPGPLRACRARSWSRPNSTDWKSPPRPASADKIYWQ